MRSAGRGTCPIDLPLTAKRGSQDPAACRTALSCHDIGPQLQITDFGTNRELAREKVWSRIHLVPLLMAEGDRDDYRREQAALAREKAIMKDVKGWEVSRLAQHSWFESDCAFVFELGCRPEKEFTTAADIGRRIL